MNWTQAKHPVAPWDHPPGLPPRLMNDRCASHAHCAYRDDDPTRCPKCHRQLTPGEIVAKCHPAQSPTDGSNVSQVADGKAGIGIPRSARPGEIGSCAKCGDTWTGTRTAHCGTCHQTFSGPTAFDIHRIGSYTNPLNPRRCGDPATRGLIPVTRPTWTGWGHPGEDTRWQDQ